MSLILLWFAFTASGAQVDGPNNGDVAVNCEILLTGQQEIHGVDLLVDALLNLNAARVIHIAPKVSHELLSHFGLTPDDVFQPRRIRLEYENRRVRILRNDSQTVEFYVGTPPQNLSTYIPIVLARGAYVPQYKLEDHLNSLYQRIPNELSLLRIGVILFEGIDFRVFLRVRNLGYLQFYDLGVDVLCPKLDQYVDLRLDPDMTPEEKEIAFYSGLEHTEPHITGSGVWCRIPVIRAFWQL